MIKAIRGTFAPDPNISTAVVALDDRLWCVLRELPGDADAPTVWGIIDFADVRAFQRRPRVQRTVPDTTDDVPPGWWALEVDDSDFLRTCRASDPQRSASALATHRHFVVSDGNHAAIDVFARAAATRAIHGPMVLDFDCLVREQEWGVQTPGGAGPGSPSR